MRWLLDTNVFIAAMRGHALVKQALERTPLQDVVLSPVVLAELQLGVEKSAHPEANARRVSSVVQHLELAPIDHVTAAHYARTRAALERRGQIIGANDLWIAAQCLALSATLVTDNTTEFERVEGLAIDNWMRPTPRKRSRR